MTRKLDETILQTILSAARKLTGAARRAFQAEVTLNYCNGSPRVAERTFGWNRDAAQRGLNEYDTNEILPNKKRTGRPCFSQRLCDLQNDIKALVDPHTQAHPRFENTFRYTRMTAQAVLDALVREKWYKKSELPALCTMRRLLNKMNYRLRRIQKTKVQKKFPKRMPSSPT